jgi:hypothetical protein
MCEAANCEGCSYSSIVALLHRGPSQECYRRFIARILPWLVPMRIIEQTGKYQTNRATCNNRRKEVWHTVNIDTLTETSR